MQDNSCQFSLPPYEPENPVRLYCGLQESFASCDSLNCRSGGSSHVTQFIFHLVITVY